MRRAIWIFLALGLLMLAAGLGLWLMRVPLAEVYLKRWCNDRALECEAEVETLGLTGAVLSNISVLSDSGTPLTVERVTADWNWRGPVSPELAAVTVDGPVLRGAYDGMTLSWLGLEAAVPAGGGESEATPAVRVSDGRVVVETPAGAVTAAVDLDVDRALSGGAKVMVPAVTLEEGEDQLTLRDAAIDLQLDKGTVSGRGALDITSARLGALALEDLSARLAVTEPEGSPLRTVTWTARLGRLQSEDASAADLDADGAAAVRAIGGMGPDALLAAVDRLDLSVRVARAGWGGFAGSALEAEAALVQADGVLSGPASVSAADVTGAAGAVDAAAFDGRLDVASFNTQTAEGRLSLGGATMAPDLRRRLGDLVPDVPGFEAHGAALQSGLDALLTAFSTALNGAITRDGAQMRLSVSGATRLTGANGAKWSVAPISSEPWLDVGAGTGSVRGGLTFEGVGAPPLSVDVETLAWGPDGVSLEARDVQLRDWRAGGTMLGAALSRLVLDVRPGPDGEGVGVGIETAGTARVAGAFGALDLAPTAVSGAVRMTRSDGAWRAETVEAGCLDLSGDGIAAGALALGRYGTTLCPPRGQIAAFGEGATGGTLAFRTLELPYRLEAGGGAIGFEGGKLAWSLDEGPGVIISADRITQDYASGGRAIALEGDGGRVAVRAAGGSLGIDANLAETRIAGDALPADLTMAGFQLSVSRRNGRLVGDGLLDDVSVVAPGDDPVFQPLQTEQTIRLSGSTLTLSGPIRLQQTGQQIADSRLALTLPSLTGTGTIVTEVLRFEPGGLQPADLSDRLRGLLTDATGSAQATAEITVDRGSPRVSARLDLDALSFQTVALGRVEGVDGEIDFDDFLALTTPPGQTVEIAAINPGLALEAGKVAFQLMGPTLLQVERARWPFAGGTVSVVPGPWQMGGLENRLEIQADALELAALVETLDMDGIEASGALSGRFPLVFSGSDANVSDALLKAIGDGGTIQYSGALGDRAGQANETAQLAFDALKDFRFEVLELGANGNLTGDLTVTIRLQGNNPDVLYGTPFAFNFSIEAPVVPLLRSGASFSGTSWLADAVVQQQSEGSE